MKNPSTKTMKGEFPEVFQALRSILLEHTTKLTVTKDNQELFYADMKGKMYRGKPLCFGGVRLGKNYVSYYLMPAYMNPKLQGKISPELKKHMQGKACFNFKHIDKSLFKELTAITVTGLKMFENINESTFAGS